MTRLGPSTVTSAPWTPVLQRDKRPPADVDVQAAVVAVAAQGLVGAGVDLPVGPLTDVSWARLLDDVCWHGLEGHLVEVIVRGELSASDEQREQAQRVHADATAMAVLLQRELLRSVDLLTDAGTDYRVLKGSALAHLVYPNPTLRSVADVALLVPSQHLESAAEALTANGAQLTHPHLRHGFKRHIGKAVSFKLPSGVHLDLHPTLAPGPLDKRFDPATLFDTSTTFSVGDRILLALGLEELLIQSCYSAVLSDDPRRLVALRDVVELCLSGSVDPARVEVLAARWSGIAVLSRAIALAWDTFRLADIVPLSVRANRYLPTRREQRLLGLYQPPRVIQLPTKLAALSLISGLAGRLAYLRHSSMGGES